MELYIYISVLTRHLKKSSVIPVKDYELKIRIYEICGFKFATCHLQVYYFYTESLDIPKKYVTRVINKIEK